LIHLFIDVTQVYGFPENLNKIYLN